MIVSKYRVVKKTTLALAAAASCALAIPALANISGTDTDLNGDFNGGLSYGSTGVAFVSALLYVGDLASTQQPKDQVLGTSLGYSYSVIGLGSPVVDIVYSFTNGLADTWTDLRFMVNVQPDGSNSFSDTVSEHWLAKQALDPNEPDRREVQDFAFNLKSSMQATHRVNNGTNGCGGAACDADTALEWDLPSLAPSASWEVRLRLVDDPSLLTGNGRYLQVTSANSAGTVLYIGNPTLVPEPESYAMLLAGLGVLGFMRIRRANRDTQ